MPHRNSKLYSLVLILIDALVLVITFVLSYIARVQYDHRPLLHNIQAYDYLLPFLLIIPFWIIVFSIVGLYRQDTYNRRLVEWAKIAIGVFLGILLVIGWEYVSDKDVFPARLVAVYALIGSFLLIVIEREIMRAIRTYRYRYGKGIRRVLLIGSSSATSDIARNIADTARSGYELIAIAGPKKILPSEFSAHHYSLVEAALKDIELNEITAIIQTDLYENSQRNQKVLSAAQSHHIDYSFIPGEAEFYSGKNTVDVFLGYPMITVYQTPLVGWGAIIKRVFDFMVSLIFSILLSPLFLVVIILQKILNPGTIFYVNDRLSRFSLPVGLLKFRSMTHIKGFDSRNVDDAAEFRAMDREDLAKEYELKQKVENDPRVNAFGRFLRRTSIDELPQIFNVLTGSLSLVGPRPILPQEVRFVRGKASLLHSVKSGITGLWQVSGRSELSFEERLELELFYAQNWTFWLDIKILFKTVLVVFKGRGAK
ncbi:MAG: Undecaprenyl-phosphate galactose phosphotransferase [Candidatus Saccharibacteria bacterium]|nr:Undecaprenyl-phosphate galactose phosphotransferase [Candidatus Saccharibacteria bacterium]